jgi:16S rRNA (guanine527-N7)-methyltransferase
LGEEQLLARELALLDIHLPGDTLGVLLRFLSELRRWNRRFNLTAITAPEEAIEKHLVDSLTLMPLLRGDEAVLDIGSGAGLPGIPLKIAIPGLKVRSVDAVGKKIDFQRHIIRLLKLEGIEARQGRIEALEGMSEFSGGSDVVVSRAFSSLSAFARQALPFLAGGGRIVAMKGPGGEEELELAGPELKRLGLCCLETRRIRLPASGVKRILIVLQRVQKALSNHKI